MTSEPGTLRINIPLDIEAFVDAIVPIVVKRLAELGPTCAAVRPDYLTAVEAAELLRCSRQRIYDLLSARRLRRYKDGSRVLLSRLELEAYLASESGAQVVAHQRTRPRDR